jgi:hypothetical protein
LVKTLTEGKLEKLSGKTISCHHLLSTQERSMLDSSYSEPAEGVSRLKRVVKLKRILMRNIN